MGSVVVKLKGGPIDSIQLESVEDVARLLQHLNGTNGAKAPPAPSMPSEPRAHAETPPSREPSEKAVKLLRELYRKREGVNGDALRSMIGVESKGLGPVVGAVRNWAKGYGLTRDDAVIRVRRRENGGVVSTLRLGAKLLKTLDAGLAREIDIA